MIEGILNDYEKVKVGKKYLEVSELKDRIRAGEERLQIETRKLDDMTNAELADYFIELVKKWKSEQGDSTTARIPKDVKNVDTNKIHKEENQSCELKLLA